MKRHITIETPDIHMIVRQIEQCLDKGEAFQYNCFTGVHSLSYLPIPEDQPLPESIA
jgi:hypothetical protein